ncbi:hypothetical protein POM88_028521 [Heracleum sosnowskyi]|uniref:Membrane-associated kinase regulator 2 n=1 Tax=Heracleum sosnowskyi TaxID=360622 RepID=A0AAD8HU65_9APIA|nr:hypothetical protein POM88_028521 [Heracleum sosnowskyi]
MEAFSLLKYWRGSGACATPTDSNITSVVIGESDVMESDEEGNGDDGPFFDMEFMIDRDNKVDIQESDDESDDCRLVPEPEPESEPDTDTKPVSKLRVLMLKLKKSTKSKGAENVVEDVKCLVPETKQSSKLFTVEEVPVLSRDNSSKISKANVEKSTIMEEEEKVFLKDTVNKYLKKVKLLYVRVSKRYGEKLMKHGISFPGKLRVVRKQSKSASSIVTVAADSPKRRDDSLLQQQDGIQSAILHCKRSFKASRELEGKGGGGGNENASAELSLLGG